MPNVEGRGRGDMHIQINAEIPVKLSGIQKKILLDYQQSVIEKNYPENHKFKTQADRFLERKKAMKK